MKHPYERTKEALLRQGKTDDEAEELIAEFQESFFAYVESGDVEKEFEDHFGLEAMDYIDEFYENFDDDDEEWDDEEEN